MSTLPSEQRSNRLPDAWVDRLFARFTAFYGSQKVGTMWVDAGMAEVKAVWAEQLARFEPASIAGALQRLVDGGNQWPPTLPEFVELCRQAALGRQSAATYEALPAPVDPTIAAQAVDAIKVIDHTKSRDWKGWARKLKARHETGAALNAYQTRCYREALRIGPEFAHLDDASC